MGIEKEKKTLNRIIFWIKINSTLSNTILFFSSFSYRFLKVSIKTENLLVKSKPSWSIRSFTYKQLFRNNMIIY